MNEERQMDEQSERGVEARGKRRIKIVRGMGPDKRC